MRCSLCGSLIRHDPFVSDGEVYCSLECQEEGMLTTNLYSDDETPALELEGLFGVSDDDDF